MSKLINKYINLFPEEALYAGLTEDMEIKYADNAFIKRFQDHLDFYEKSLFQTTFEKINKVFTGFDRIQFNLDIMY